MSARKEITKKYAREYASASKKDKGRMLDELIATTEWSRPNAGRALANARKRKGPARSVKRRPRPRTYGYDTLKLLIQVWNLAGRPSGKYLAATMSIWLPALEAHEELDQTRLTEHTRAQLLKISGATIDRLLKPTRDRQQLKGISGTTSGPLRVIRFTSARQVMSRNNAPASWKRIWCCTAAPPWPESSPIL